VGSKLLKPFQRSEKVKWSLSELVQGKELLLMLRLLKVEEGLQHESQLKTLCIPVRTEKEIRQTISIEYSSANFIH